MDFTYEGFFVRFVLLDFPARILLASSEVSMFTLDRQDTLVINNDRSNNFDCLRGRTLHFIASLSHNEEGHCPLRKSQLNT